MSIFVFVYGSLKKGKSNHSVLTDRAQFMRPATIQGAVMVDLGSFPAIIKGTGEVTGEVYSITPEIMARLDRLEGHPRFYKREIIDIGEGQQAWTYYLSESNAKHINDNISQYRIVANGNW